MTRLTLFATPRVGGNQAISFLPDMRYQFLAFLATKSDWVSRDELATLFYPATTTKEARDALRQLLKRSKKLGFAQLETERERIRWQADTDVQAFNQALEQADYEQVYNLYQGYFLETLESSANSNYLSWLEHERNHYHARYRQAMFRWIQNEPHAGEHTLKATERLLELDPFDEDALQQLLSIAATLGHTQQGLYSYKEFTKTLRKDLDLEPTAKTEVLARQLKERQQAPVAVIRKPNQQLMTASSANSVQNPLSSFVGRELELSALMHLLKQPDCHLLTITGIGGVGKSRLVVEAQAELQTYYPDGVHLVALDALENPKAMIRTIAYALNSKLNSQDGELEQLASVIANKHLLLILDNFEHIMDAAIDIAALIHSCPKLDVLITSREILNLEEEWLLELEGLSYPLETVTNDVEHYDAIQLFMRRAQRVRFDTELTPDTLPNIIQICQRLQGTPLALELAAAWVRRMSLETLAQQLEQNLDLLASQSKNKLERHRSLRISFEHSWQLLTPVEQDTLKKLSVFRGGFRLEAAKIVTNTSIAVLSALLDKSLLRMDGTGRYDRHPLLYEFAQEKLDDAGEMRNIVQLRHANYYQHLLKQLADKLKAGGQPSTLDIFFEEWQNIQQVYYWMVNTRQLDNFVAYLELMDICYDGQGRFVEALNYLSFTETALNAKDCHKELGCTLIHKGWYHFRLGQYEDARECTERGLQLVQPLKQHRLIVRGLNTLGAIFAMFGKSTKARAYFEQALKRAYHTDEEQVANSLNNLAIVESDKGFYQQATKHLLEALILHRKRQRFTEIVRTQTNLGILYLFMNKLAKARVVFDEALGLAHTLPFEQAIPPLLNGLGTVHLKLEDYEQARLHFEKALRLSKDSHALYGQIAALAELGRIAFAQSHFHQANRHLTQALTLAWDTKDIFNCLNILHIVAECELKRDNITKAITYMSLVNNHDGTRLDIKTATRQTLDKLGQSTNPDMFEKAKAEGQKITLESVVNQLLTKATLI